MPWKGPPRQHPRPRPSSSHQIRGECGPGQWRVSDPPWASRCSQCLHTMQHRGQALLHPHMSLAQDTNVNASGTSCLTRERGQNILDLDQQKGTHSSVRQESASVEMSEARAAEPDVAEMHSKTGSAAHCSCHDWKIVKAPYLQAGRPPRQQSLLHRRTAPCCQP